MLIGIPNMGGPIVDGHMSRGTRLKVPSDAHMRLRTCLLVFTTVSCLSSLVSSQLAVLFYAFFEAERA